LGEKLRSKYESELFSAATIVAEKESRALSGFRKLAITLTSCRWAANDRGRTSSIQHFLQTYSFEPPASSLCSRGAAQPSVIHRGSAQAPQAGLREMNDRIILMVRPCCSLKHALSQAKFNSAGKVSVECSAQSARAPPTRRRAACTCGCSIPTRSPTWT